MERKIGLPLNEVEIELVRNGQTSTALFKHCLRSIDMDVSSYIPGLEEAQLDYISGLTGNNSGRKIGPALNDEEIMLVQRGDINFALRTYRERTENYDRDMIIPQLREAREIYERQRNSGGKE